LHYSICLSLSKRSIGTLDPLARVVQIPCVLRPCRYLIPVDAGK